ncbi:hypothetical protein S7335_5035 [Synechococcus sp. PCC 7335]|nr:hypothetical protein S7335_5035 [Synechococcus sp. PCC 7335]
MLVISLVILISFPFQQIKQQFKDGGFINIFSGIQLFVVAFYARRVFKIGSVGFRRPWRSPAAIWGIISAGFAFLALDELATIHEGIDKLIHIVFNLQETGLSDRIDDLIVGLYGVAAIALLVIYRQELKRYRFVFPYVLGGFVLLFCMIGIDTLTNRDDILLTFLSATQSDSLLSWIFILEETCKLVSEVFFVTAAKYCEQIGRRDRSPAAIESSQPLL